MESRVHITRNRLKNVKVSADQVGQFELESGEAGQITNEWTGGRGQIKDTIEFPFVPISAKNSHSVAPIFYKLQFSSAPSRQETCIPLDEWSLTLRWVDAARPSRNHWSETAASRQLAEDTGRIELDNGFGLNALEEIPNADGEEATGHPLFRRARDSSCSRQRLLRRKSSGPVHLEPPRVAAALEDLGWPETLCRMQPRRHAQSVTLPLL